MFESYPKDMTQAQLLKREVLDLLSKSDSGMLYPVFLFFT